MKLVLSILFSVFAASAAYAQTWQCYSGEAGALVACAPGSPNCACSQTLAAPAPPPVAAAPTCPPMTYWNGVTCVVPAPAYVQPYYNPYQGYHQWDHPHQH